MNLDNIKTTFDLLKAANCASFVTIIELSKELGVRKTQLAAFISDNSNLFKVSERWMPKKQSVWEYNYITQKKQKAVQIVRGKSLGLCIDNVYLKEEDNPVTDAWLNKQIEQYKDYIEVTVVDTYGYVLGYCINLSEGRAGLWKNTKEKIAKIKEAGLLSTQTFTFGGFGDSYSQKYTNVVSSIEKLEELGWKHNELPKLGSYQKL